MADGKIDPNATDASASETRAASWPEGDQDDPLNWSPRKKWGTMLLISLMATLTALASTLPAPAIELILFHFESSSQTLGAFTISIFTFGMAFGPFFIAPVCELFGRYVAFNATMALFLCTTIGCALAPTLSFLIGFRFLQGFMASAAPTIAAGSIPDIFRSEDRGKATAMFYFGVAVSPSFAPIAGGYVSENVGWRWTFWVVAIAAGVMLIMGALLLRESNRALLLRRKLAKGGLAGEKLSAGEDTPAPAKADAAMLWRALQRPFKLLVSPLLAVPALAVAITYSYLILVIAIMPFVFSEIYHFSPGTVGLSYLGIGISGLFGSAILGRASDRIMVRKTAANGGVSKPEFRLGLMMLGGPLSAIGLFCFGWSAKAGVHWMVPIIGTVFVSLGVAASMMPISAYIIETYDAYAASASAANTWLRCTLGGVLPLAAPDLYRILGLGWGNSLLAFIALGTTPMIFIFSRYCERLRLKYKIDL